jgi:DNA-binding MarR family transcriptional regulator
MRSQECQILTRKRFRGPPGKVRCGPQHIRLAGHSVRKDQVWHVHIFRYIIAKDMQLKPLEMALNLYEIAVPIFVSLKEQVHPASPKARSHPDVKELTFTQLRILLAIEYGKDQVGKLARSAQVAQPAMSKTVNRLIRLDFVRRDPHPTDRRQIKLRLTPKGAAMTRRVRLKAAEKYVDAIKNLSASDQNKLLDGIEVILDVIENTRREST